MLTQGLRVQAEEGKARQHTGLPRGARKLLMFLVHNFADLRPKNHQIYVLFISTWRSSLVWFFGPKFRD